VARNDDIRIKTSLFASTKWEVLEDEMGAKTQLCLIKLWAEVAVHKCRGRLDGWSDRVIAKRAGWTDGPPGEWVSDLVRLRWLDRDEAGVISIHNWLEHQPYAYHAPERAEKSRQANEIKRLKAAAKVSAELARLRRNTGPVTDPVTGEDTSDDTPSPSSSSSSSSDRRGGGRKRSLSGQRSTCAHNVGSVEPESIELEKFRRATKGDYSYATR